jgi:hypothetical protein
MLEGLAETERALINRNIGLVIRMADDTTSERAFARFCAEMGPSLVICDEDPARRDAQWRREALGS